MRSHSRGCALLVIEMIGVYMSNCRMRLVALRLGGSANAPARAVTCARVITHPSMLGPKKMSMRTKSYLVLFIFSIAPWAFSTVSVTHPNFSRNLLESWR